jgi:hypothetical protein
MSYHSLHFANGAGFFMAAETFPAAIAAVRRDVQQETDDTAWPYKLEDLLASLLEDAEPRRAFERILDACGWKATFDVGGNITEVGLTEDASQYDALDILWTESLFWTLAPFVRRGSRIYLTNNHARAWVYRFRDGACQDEYFHDYTRPDGMMVPRELLERLHAYVMASDVTGGGPAAELLADLNRALGR